jgi:hypothetical protein
MQSTQAVSLKDLDKLPQVAAEITYGKVVPGIQRYRYDTVDRSRTNLVLEKMPMNIHDVRGIKDQLSYQINGFELREHKSQFAHLADTDAVTTAEGLAHLKEKYEGEMSEYLRKLTGSNFVFPQPGSGFFVRHGSKSRIKTEQRPATLAHVDFTAKTAREKVEEIKQSAGPLPKFRAFAIYQSWRAVSPPPQDSILCFCDGRSITTDDCQVVDSIMGPEDVPGNVYLMQMGLYRPAHAWFYFSNLKANEVILFQGYDERHPLPVMHTAFKNREPGATYRVSIECRHYVFFE